MTDLLPIPESLSPRQAWLRAHKAHTRLEQLPRARIGPATTKPWSCCNPGETICGFGEDELEATIEYARTIGVEHWMQAELRRQVREGRTLEDEAGPIILED